MSAFQSITSCFLVIASLQLPANSGFRLSKVPDTSTSSPPGMFEAAAVNTVHHKAHGTHKTGEEGSHRQRRHYSIDRQRRSVSGRGRHRPHRSSGAEIFQERLGADPWSSILGNPCRAEPTPRAFAQEEVLDVAGRESEIKLMSSGVIQALRVLKTDMSVDECQDQFAETLPPLPNVTAALTTREFSVELLSDIYKSFYFLSAHFHFMRRDWLEGASCSRFPETLLPQLARLSRTFHEGMCLLMTAADPHPLASPYPSDSMLREHEMRLNTEIYRYHDCSGRVVRDCIVVSYAEKLADLVFAKAALREL